MKRILFAAVATTFLTSYATPMTAEPTGESRAGGIVKLSFEDEIFQSSVVDGNAVDMSARQSCNAWGYLQKFGGGRVD